MRTCKICNRLYDDESINDRIWHGESWGCRKRIADGYELTCKERLHDFGGASGGVCKRCGHFEQCG